MRVARWGLGLFLVLAACGGTGAGERATPVEVDPNNAAFLAVVDGQVSIRKADGAVAPAVAESTLARSDTLITGPDGRVVVVLHNSHVVKLGTSLEKRVDKLAHFDDPPPSQDLAQLFEEALGADYEKLGGKDKLERIAGWNARRASGETPAPVTKAEAPPPMRDEVDAPTSVEEEKHDAPRIQGERGAGGGSIADVPTPSDPAPREPAAEKKAQKRDRPTTNTGAKGIKSSRRSEEIGNDGGAEIGVPAPPTTPAPQGGPAPTGGVPAELADAWTLETGSNGQVQRVMLPAPLAERRAELARCIAGAGKTELTLEVKGGTIRAVRFGAQAASCASELVDVKLPDLGDATVTVRLKK